MTMKKAKETKPTPQISAARVREKTGKSWDEWFAILDQFDVRENGHKAAAQYLYEKQRCPEWWSQMVTVTYEQARGLRQKHEKPDGYAVSASKTVAVPLARLYTAWKNKKVRDRWLPDAVITIRKATPDKSMRITWADGKSHVDANFYAKGENKSQVAVQHSKLGNAKEAARQKAYWAERLNHLKGVLEA